MSEPYPFLPWAIRLLEGIPPEALEPERLADVCRELAPLDLERAARYVSFIPESAVEARSRAVYEVACEMVRQDAPRALALAADIPDPARQQQAYCQMALNLADTDFATARAILENHDPDSVLPTLLYYWPADEVDTLLTGLQCGTVKPNLSLIQSWGEKAIRLLANGDETRGRALWEQANQWLATGDAAARQQALRLWIVIAVDEDLWPPPRDLLQEVDGLLCSCNECLAFLSHHNRPGLLALAERVDADCRATIWQWAAADAAKRHERGEAWQWLHRIARIEGGEWPPVLYWLEAAREVGATEPTWALEVAEAAQRLAPQDTEDTWWERVLLLAELGVALREHGAVAEGEAKLDEVLQRVWEFGGPDDRLEALLRLALTLAGPCPERAQAVLSSLEQQLLPLNEAAREGTLESLLDEVALWEAFPTWAERMFGHVRSPWSRVIVLLRLAREQAEAEEEA